MAAGWSDPICVPRTNGSARSAALETGEAALCCCGHPRNGARVHRMARLWRLLLEDGWRLEPEGEQETLETKVVSNGVEGVCGYPGGEG